MLTLFFLLGPNQEKIKNDKLKKVSGKDKDACNLALQLLEVNKAKIVDLDSKNVDSAIIKLSKESTKNIVCTLDREMRKKLPRVILITRMGKLMLTR